MKNLALIFCSAFTLLSSSCFANQIDNISSVSAVNGECKLAATPDKSGQFDCTVNETTAGNSTLSLNFSAMVSSLGTVPKIRCHFKNAYSKPKDDSHGYKISVVSKHSFTIEKIDGQKQDPSNIVDVPFSEHASVRDSIQVDQCQALQ